MKRFSSILILASLACQVGLMLLLGYMRRYQIHPDTVSYIRIASYYANGRTDLAVSGYWGPMLSWLIAPLLGLFNNPLFAARVVMGLSGLVFTAGCLSAFRGLQLPPAGMVVGSWLVALTAAHWSACTISPDLLTGGLTCLAVGCLLSPRWVIGRMPPLVAGLLLGAAYLAKAVALPLAVLLVAGITVLWRITSLADRRTLLRASTFTLIGLALVAGPWVAVLSRKYGRPTFSTAARIAHAIVALEVPRYGDGPSLVHPINHGFYQPEPGRITTWEDPTDLPYKYWSPFESRGHFKHQIKVIITNLFNLTRYFTWFDVLSFGTFGVALCFLVHAPWQENMKRDRWRWAGVPVTCIGLIYLPLYSELRYHLTIYPFIISSTYCVICAATSGGGRGIGFGWIVGIALMVVSFGTPILYSIHEDLQRADSDVDWLSLANGLGKMGVGRAIASDNATGMFVALMIDRPFYGCDSYATPENFAKSGADIIIVSRDSTIAGELGRRDDFTNLNKFINYNILLEKYMIFKYN